MKTLDNTFQSNANQTGVMTFEKVKHDVSQNGKGVYIYKRTRLDGRVFGFEVFTPSALGGPNGTRSIARLPNVEGTATTSATP